jgi:hypothetical protein
VGHHALYVFDRDAVRNRPGGVGMAQVVEPEAAVSRTSHDGQGRAAEYLEELRSIAVA